MVETEATSYNTEPPPLGGGRGLGKTAEERRGDGSGKLIGPDEEEKKSKWGNEERTNGDSSSDSVNKEGNSGRHSNDIKVDIPEYDGKLDPDEFVEWIRRLFDYKETTDDNKVKIVALKLRKYASTWWSNVCLKRERMGKEKIRTWPKMKAKMKQKFLPPHHIQASFSQLHSLKQGAGLAEDYSREFEYLLMKCDIPEDDPQTLVRTSDPDEEVVGPDGELVVVRQALSSTPVREEKLQREAIFHTSKTESDHQTHLQQLFTVLAREKLYGNLEKCDFFANQITFLGYLVSAQGIQVDDTKIQAIRDWPIPYTIQQVRSFHGFAFFYRRFIKNFSTIVAPMIEVTKYKHFEWNPQAQMAFEELKRQLSSTPFGRCRASLIGKNVTRIASCKVAYNLLRIKQRPISPFKDKHIRRRGIDRQEEEPIQSPSEARPRNKSTGRQIKVGRKKQWHGVGFACMGYQGVGYWLEKKIAQLLVVLLGLGLCTSSHGVLKDSISAEALHEARRKSLQVPRKLKSSIISNQSTIEDSISIGRLAHASPCAPPRLPVRSPVLKIDENGHGSGHFGACLVRRDERSLCVFVSDEYSGWVPFMAEWFINEGPLWKSQITAAKELRDNTFSGSEHEDANEHIQKVLEIVDLFHVPKITQDQLKLRAFPVSLTGATSHWLRNEPADSITTWEVLKTKFLNKYCPPAHTAKKMEEINNFQQEPDESLFRTWERFKELLMKYP
ncbi:putative unclassified retrotransposon protein [Tanacetum coccineum]